MNYKEIEKINEKHLEEFEEFLSKRNYRERITTTHVSRVDAYINHYLMVGLPKEMEKGCSFDVVNFIENFVNVKVLPVSVHNIDFFLGSVSLFYECMVEKKYVSRKDYEEMLRDIRECKDEMIEDYYDKNPEVIDVLDVVEVMEMASGYGRGYLNVKTGEKEFIPEDESVYPDDIEELYDKIDRPDWVEVPEIVDYKIMNDFALSLDNKEITDKLITILHNRKAYRNFKDALYEMEIEDDYYDFHDDAVYKLAQQWFEENVEEI